MNIALHTLKTQNFSSIDDASHRKSNVRTIMFHEFEVWRSWRGSAGLGYTPYNRRWKAVVRVMVFHRGSTHDRAMVSLHRKYLPLRLQERYNDMSRIPRSGERCSNN
jgi:hypothetical protein